jgi:hypothetical protein|tara:strand:+ start:4638 stop:4913 length:276 start_codon:yes stop_codon:yes gene_type:complete
MAEMTEAWDGTEDYQTFLDRACTWMGAPVTAIEIEAKEAAYDARMIEISTPENVLRRSIGDNSLVKAMIRREARKEGKTEDQVITELASEF